MEEFCLKKKTLRVVVAEKEIKVDVWWCGREVRWCYRVR